MGHPPRHVDAFVEVDHFPLSHPNQDQDREGLVLMGPGAPCLFLLLLVLPHADDDPCHRLRLRALAQVQVQAQIGILFSFLGHHEDEVEVLVQKVHEVEVYCSARARSLLDRGEYFSFVGLGEDESFAHRHVAVETKVLLEADLHPHHHHDDHVLNLHLLCHDADLCLHHLCHFGTSPCRDGHPVLFRFGDLCHHRLVSGFCCYRNVYSILFYFHWPRPSGRPCARSVEVSRVVYHHDVEKAVSDHSCLDRRERRDQPYLDLAMAESLLQTLDHGLGRSLESVDRNEALEARLTCDFLLDL